jgi:hypothetical protein
VKRNTAASAMTADATAIAAIAPAERPDRD